MTRSTTRTVMAAASTKRPVHVRAWHWWRSRTGQVKFALVLLVVTVFGWPLSALTFARNEPATVLGLSWMAITITAVDVLFTSRVQETQNGEGSGDTEG